MEFNRDALNLKMKLDQLKEKKKNNEKLNNDRDNAENMEIGGGASKEEILSEYFQFLRNLPVLPDHELKRLINNVKCAWGIDEILQSQLKPETLLHVGKGIFLTDKLSTKLGQSLRILAPPVKVCLLCKGKLSVSNHPTQIVVHSLTGPCVYSKYILKCQKCRLIEKSKFDPLYESLRQDIYYHPDKYGNKSHGHMFYKKDIPYIKGTNEVFLTRSLVESKISNFMHGFMSMESAAEAYNETHRESATVEQFKDFIRQNPKVGNHFDAKAKEVDDGDTVEIPLSEEFNEKEAYENGKRVQNGMHELDRKAIVSSFFHSWIQEELKERNMNFMFGPYHKEGGGQDVLVTFRDSVEDFIKKVDNFRSEEIYKHDDCTGKDFL